MIEIRPVNEQDFALVQPRAIYEVGSAKAAKGSQDRATVSFAALDDGVLLGLFFGNLIFSGNMHAWALTTDAIAEKKLLFIKATRFLVESTARVHGLHRMQMTVKAESEYGDWPKILGFNCEGTLMQYGWDKSDYKMFARMF